MASKWDSSSSSSSSSTASASPASPKHQESRKRARSPFPHPHPHPHPLPPPPAIVIPESPPPKTANKPQRLQKKEPCNPVTIYQKLNWIDEGSYGIVYRAKHKETQRIVALKKLKLEKENNGFPITSLREIGTLKKCKHPNIIEIIEVVTGNDAIFMVMEFLEHDLKSVLSQMKQPFLQSEIKCLLQQILSAIAYLHSNWIIHRDLKTSNLLMNNQGELKVADFGLARTYGKPPVKMTDLVVTLWYRAPELLLGAKTYTTAIDDWSVGCIFAELITKEPLFPGQGEVEQINLIFAALGQPSASIWPDYPTLPHVQTFTFKTTTNHSVLYKKFAGMITEAGLDLLHGLLTYDPSQRMTCASALSHRWFEELPRPKEKAIFPTFPSKGAGYGSNLHQLRMHMLMWKKHPCSDFESEWAAEKMLTKLVRCPVRIIEMTR